MINFKIGCKNKTFVQFFKREKYLVLLELYLFLSLYHSEINFSLRIILFQITGFI